MTDPGPSSRYPCQPHEIPLDLTVRRTEMENDMYSAHMNSMATPSQDYTAYQHQYSDNYYSQYPSHDYMPANHQQYNNSSTYQPINHGYVMSPEPPTSRNSPPSSYSYENANNNQDFHIYNGYNVLPKKRKTIWRPYDSKNQQHNQQRAPLEVETDSGSETGSSSSDQEFKTPLSPVDPIKRRKRNMLRYAEDQTDSSLESNYSSSHLGSSIVISSDVNTIQQSISDPVTSYTPSLISMVSQKSPEKQISKVDPVKRDVFGWSLKLSQPLEDIPRAASESDTTVCQDGEKTYIELQTVKSVDQANISENISETTTVQNGHTSATKLRDSPTGKKGNKNKKKQQSDNERSGNIVGKKVFIQRRDNVIESFDETNSEKEKPSETKKGISIIDLIEEIEADALKDKYEQEKTNQQNDAIVKLLRQCNHVKLQALDILMSNVLIQESGPTFKRQNEKVQKILNGDKISSMNMLDVVELQVEMALS